MHDMPSKFIEILYPEDSAQLKFSDSDVRLEDVLASHEALVSRPRSSTQSSLKASIEKDRESSSSPPQRWKRLSNILIPKKN
ncbi:hypothetical protein EYZ11_003307 [Aspergillus tanneri]|uniref:Uncharacterized protein n=1 Tax=Aspergillus tanneri TaxID=1220188 RepID=A0A4S3JQQ7_9EURO|nr:uncharacterized protein ATNIH1004_001745 [Aspergillus tanneri]KAA8652836.1 hypothetical protein ATNIH1004_001745 [Aspergillus tanneri]THC97198.1 hypothetical protein EYZ11_003307 [Aspergillus tanneri]